jgi:hypothetical protein
MRYLDHCDHLQPSIRSWIFSVSLVAVLLFPISAIASELASPCLPAPANMFPAADEPPVIGVWHEKELLQANWNPPSCTGWSSAAHSRLLITLAGQFTFNGSLDNLLDRIGAISSMREIRYWSADDKAWRPLVSDASALTSSSPASRRGDFNANDLTDGAQLFYLEKDSQNRETVYRLNIHVESPDCFVLTNENVTPIRRFFLTIFRPFTLQSAVVLRKTSANTFGVYMFNRTDKAASSLSEGHEKTYVNRAVALYRQLIGVKTDSLPAAAE